MQEKPRPGRGFSISGLAPDFPGQPIQGSIDRQEWLGSPFVNARISIKALLVVAADWRARSINCSPQGINQQGPMRNTLLLIALLLASTTSFAGTEPGINVTARVNRTSEFELTQKQTERFDEATKLSAASRVFHGLYDRWPKDVDELAARTSGLDLAVFEGKVMIETVAEGITVTFFDSLDIRRLLITEEMEVVPEIRALAHDPEFRIRVSVQVSLPNDSSKPNARAD